jgi:hypothetical protein
VPTPIRHQANGRKPMAADEVQQPSHDDHARDEGRDEADDDQA